MKIDTVRRAAERAIGLAASARTFAIIASEPVDVMGGRVASGAAYRAVQALQRAEDELHAALRWLDEEAAPPAEVPREPDIKP